MWIPISWTNCTALLVASNSKMNIEEGFGIFFRQSSHYITMPVSNHNPNTRFINPSMLVLRVTNRRNPKYFFFLAGRVFITKTTLHYLKLKRYLLAKVATLSKGTTGSFNWILFLWFYKNQAVTGNNSKVWGLSRTFYSYLLCNDIPSSHLYLVYYE